MLAPVPTDIVRAQSVAQHQELREIAPHKGGRCDVVQNTPAESSAPQLDTGRYRHHLVDYQLTDVQAEEFLGTLWNVILACIDLQVDLDLEAVLTGSAPPEKAMPAATRDAELSSSRKQNRLAIDEGQPAERCRGGR